MATAAAAAPVPVRLVIFDLDGTLVDTETLVKRVCQELCETHFQVEYREQANTAGLGMTPLNAAGVVVRELGLPCNAQEYYELSSVGMKAGYSTCGAMPGAARLIAHLRARGVRMALATSSRRYSLGPKLTPHGWHDGVFEESVCGCDVEHGKPAPDIFLEAARRCGVPPEACLVVEDAPAGVQAATAAGMRSIVVPTMRNAAELYTQAGATLQLNSLLDLKPDVFGLPAFGDTVGEVAIPVDVWRVKGEVIAGFGRGGKDIGCPTANLPTEVLDKCAAATSSCGIYVGWASLGAESKVYKMVMSVGWNPFYKNEKKSVEPHLLHEFEEDFYGSELRLVVCGYLRPEASFDSFEALVAAIEGDKVNAHKVLGMEPFAQHADDEYLRPS